MSSNHGKYYVPSNSAFNNIICTGNTGKPEILSGK